MLQQEIPRYYYLSESFTKRSYHPLPSHEQNDTMDQFVLFEHERQGF